MPTLDQLKHSCRESDDQASVKPLELVAIEVGTNLADLTYIAEQRAMRMVMIEEGVAIPKKHIPVKFNDEQHRRFQKYLVAYLDGLIIGLRASLLKDST